MSTIHSLRQSLAMPGFRSMIRSIASARGLDDEQQPHRLVDLHHLPGQPGPQVAGRAVHHADERGDVVRQLGAAAPARVVDVREVVFQVDPRADGKDGLQRFASGSSSRRRPAWGRRR